MNREEDIKLTEWGIRVFLKSVSLEKEAEPRMFTYGAHYADSNPDPSFIGKVLRLSAEYDKEKQEIKDKITREAYIKDNWK